ncbi:enoyl-CoA hydratase/isomerase family protein [Bosea sp. TWI1241]|uniref:enoyl-CoA hydratase/isomerase family protein n=1 Tax=Bosea sp. TWI1241 TaxID=3148904 RepID=UPI003209A613
MTEELAFETDGPIARITLRRPAKLNALTPAMLSALVAACDAIDTDPAIRCALLLAEGKAFCAGADINAWSGLSPVEMWQRWIVPGHSAFGRLAALRVPSIAVVEGPCFGGGLELALCCDMRFASQAANFSMPEVSIGTLPGWGGTGRLPRAVGLPRARQMIFSGERVEATRAEQWGLVNGVFDGDGARAEAERLAALIASRAPVAVAAAKLALAAQENDAPMRALEALGGAIASASADAREGLASFREKRPPVWQGR